MKSTRRFSVALSFPGEFRSLVRQIAEELASLYGKEKVFYDEFYQEELAIPNLDTKLQKIYHDNSDLIVIFICAEYNSKNWCGVEFRAIRDLINQRNNESRIMFIKCGDGEVDGFFSSVDGYIDSNKIPPSELSSMIAKRLSSLENEYVTNTCTSSNTTLTTSACKKVKISYSDLFKNIAIACVSTATLDWSGLIDTIVELIKSFSFDNPVEAKAWKLITVSMAKAVYDLLKDNDIIASEWTEYRITNLVVDKLDNIQIELTQNFLSHPLDSDFVQYIVECISEWIVLMGTNQNKANAIASRVPHFFVFALYEEWRNNSADYISLENYYFTPFRGAELKTIEWLHYNSWLKKQVNESVFEEVFSLEQIYIPLHAYYEKKVILESLKSDESVDNAKILSKNEIKEKDDKKSKKDRGKSFENEKIKFEKKLVITKKVSFEIAEHLKDWICSKKGKEFVKIVCGGPGSGKSSFAKIFASELSKITKVLLIPLQRMNMEQSLEFSVGQYLKLAGFFDANPCLDESTLVMIFDGLDELSQLGNVGLEVSRKFLADLNTFVLMRNQTSTHIKAIVTSRDIAILGSEGIFDGEQQILHLHSYVVSEENLDLDMRDKWWKEYGRLIGKDYYNMPYELKHSGLFELTSQPLLNYLVALSYARGKINLSESTNLNEIYEDLINAVFERAYELKKHQSLFNIDRDEFIFFLECIALCIWHDTGRITTITAIENYFLKRKNHDRNFEILQKQMESKITKLLIAFYFRHSNNINGTENTFELTHKSFGEYLVARHIVRKLKRISDDMTVARTIGTIQDEIKKVLLNWIMDYRQSSVDVYIANYLNQEIHLNNINDVVSWQDALCEIIEHFLYEGLPFESLEDRPSLFDESVQSRNAEKMLLVALSACSYKTERISKIKWPDETCLGEWISRLKGQRRGREVPLISRCLHDMDMSGCKLIMQDFYGADLTNSNLSDCDLRGSEFRNAKINNTKWDRSLVLSTDYFATDYPAGHIINLCIVDDYDD